MRRSTDGAYLFAPPRRPGTAVLGSRAGRRSTAETAAAADAMLRRSVAAQAIPVERHTCGGYTVLLACHDVCDACGWGPGFAFPDVETVARALREQLGPDDARAWLDAVRDLLSWDE